VRQHPELDSHVIFDPRFEPHVGPFPLFPARRPENFVVSFDEGFNLLDILQLHDFGPVVVVQEKPLEVLHGLIVLAVIAFSVRPLEVQL